MNEIRDRAKEEIIDILVQNYSLENREAIAGAILSIPELAVVDREQIHKLGINIAYYLGLQGGTELYKNYPENFNRIIGEVAEQLIQLGWVKEVKE